MRRITRNQPPIPSSEVAYLDRLAQTRAAQDQQAAAPVLAILTERGLLPMPVQRNEHGYLTIRFKKLPTATRPMQTHLIFVSGLWAWCGSKTSEMPRFGGMIGMGNLYDIINGLPVEV